MAGSLTLESPFSVRLGRAWFRWRSISPLPFFLLMAVLPSDFSLSLTGVVIVGLGILMGEALRIWAVGYAGSATRTRGDTVPILIHAGPYRFTRNPLYVGNILLYSLGGVLFGFTALTALLFVFSCAEYHFIVRFEESILRSTFGKAYAEYCKAVPRWGFASVPYPSSAHSFSLTRALRSERSTFFSMAAIFVSYGLKQALTTG